MYISIIVAMTSNYVIGRLNGIPWFLPSDMVWFKYHTLNKPIIMGRKTFESIGNKPLLNRFNVVLSRKIIKKSTFNLFFAKTLEEALWIIKKTCNNYSEIMIIGGREIYNIFFPYVNRLYLTYVDVIVFGDILFPSYKKEQWKVIFSKYNHADIFNHAHCFKIFERY